MNLSVIKKGMLMRPISRASQFVHSQSKALAAVAGGLPLSFGVIGQAMAQTATSPAGSIGAQLNSRSSEAINSGSTAFGMGCYLAAAICFGFGVWSLWQSRHPQNRESGHVAKGLAGLVASADAPPLCRVRPDQDAIAATHVFGARFDPLDDAGFLSTTELARGQTLRFLRTGFGTLAGTVSFGWRSHEQCAGQCGCRLPALSLGATSRTAAHPRRSRGSCMSPTRQPCRPGK